MSSTKARTSYSASTIICVAAWWTIPGYSKMEDRGENDYSELHDAYGKK
jgi:hypothetical protein